MAKAKFHRGQLLTVRFDTILWASIRTLTDIRNHTGAFQTCGALSKGELVMVLDTADEERDGSYIRVLSGQGIGFIYHIAEQTRLVTH